MKKKILLLLSLITLVSCGNQFPSAVITTSSNSTTDVWNKGVVTGKVLNKKTNDPISGVEIYLESNTITLDGILKVETNENGEYRFENLLAAGYYISLIVPPTSDYKDYTLSVNFFLNSTLPLYEVEDILLEKEDIIYGDLH